MKYGHILLAFCLAALVLSAANKKPRKHGRIAEPSLPTEFRGGGADRRVSTANYGPKRLKPVFTGPFQVDLVCITFPDCEQPEAATVQNDLNSIGGGLTIKDYYVDYSQGITFPVLAAYPTVYVAPQPYGYYCRWNRWNNRIGWTNDGGERAAKLRADALAFAKSRSRGFHPGAVTCYVYCHRLDRSKVEQHLRGAYPKPKKPEDKDEIGSYNPQVAWAEPLWPNSLPQVTWPGGGGTLVHELGHVLGSPDYYHCPEKHDGMPGAPALPWSYSPTGMAWDRVIYHAFVPPATYPMLRADGTYTLNARSTKIPKPITKDTVLPVLGCFIPSSHPNYVFCVEYVANETRPVGHPGDRGLLIHAINVTFSSPMMGPPDLCYTYRKNDVFMKGLSGDAGNAYFHTGDSFSMTTDPTARIPPLIDGGIEITDIRESEDTCSFKLHFTKPKFSPAQLQHALLPRIRIVSVDEVQPNSMRATCDFMYRGEPLLDEYGFTWDTSKNPTIKKNKLPLFHRDRFDARILDLRPGTTYYVRAYVKNVNGITYSKREIEVKTPLEKKEVPPLLTDHIRDNFYLTRWYFQVDADQYYNSANTIIALMQMGVYYGKMPGGETRGFDIRRVHTHPSENRPPFRMSEFERYFGAMKGLADASGLRHRDFGKKPALWIKACARALKIKNPNKAFVPVPTADALEAQRPAIRKWLEKSQPVWLVRENTFKPDITNHRFPLDIAIIDGCFEDGTWHVSFPLGSDRSDGKVRNGYHDAKTLMDAVTNAYLMFYRPGM